MSGGHELDETRESAREARRKVARGKREARGPWNAASASIRALEVHGLLAPFQGANNSGNLIQARRDLRSLAPGYLLTAPPALRSILKHDASSMLLPF